MVNALILVVPDNSDTSIKRIKIILPEKDMISLRKISFLVRQHEKGEYSASQLCKLAKVSKSSFYRIINSYAGLGYYHLRKKIAEKKPPGRPAKQIPIEQIQAVLQKGLKQGQMTRLLQRCSGGKK